MINAVSRSSRLGKYRYSAEDTMPSSRATARNDMPSAPDTANWRRAASLISLVSTARARSRAVWLVVMSASMPEARALLKFESTGQFQEHWSASRAPVGFESTALDSGQVFVFTALNREHCSHKPEESTWPPIGTSSPSAPPTPST